ncbi:MAG: radical SAM protein [Methanomassiliicoccales archaeon]|nr:radical SAM protein [Methanomassiliicoccales archaeon]
MTTTTRLESFDLSGPKEVMFECVECKSALSRSKLPGLDYALNPYVGCAHDCAYCYAPYVLGIDRSAWGSRVRVKSNLPRLLAKELIRSKGMIGVGTVTDPYQPLERETSLTRTCLGLMVAKRARFSILTKSDLVVRDIDLIKRSFGSEVGVTITTLDDEAAASIERNAPSPSRRLDTVRRLVSEGINAYVLVGPVLPNVTDRDLDSFMGAIADTGAKRIMTDRLRLRPGMLAPLGDIVDSIRSSSRGFADLVGSPGLLDGMVRDVERTAKEHGLRVESAFQAERQGSSRIQRLGTR